MGIMKIQISELLGQTVPPRNVFEFEGEKNIYYCNFLEVFAGSFYRMTASLLGLAPKYMPCVRNHTVLLGGY